MTTKITPVPGVAQSVYHLRHPIRMRKRLPGTGKKRLTIGHVRALAARAAAICSESSGAAARVDRALRWIDKTCRFSRGADQRLMRLKRGTDSQRLV